MFAQLDSTHYVRARAISAIEACGHGVAKPYTWRYHIVLRDAPPIDFETIETPDQLMARLNVALLAKAPQPDTGAARLERQIANHEIRPCFAGHP